MFCIKCGNKRKEGDKFCASCGTTLGKDSPNGATETVVTQNYEKIGGWLILVGIGLVLMPFLLAYGVFDSLPLLSNGGLETMNSLIPGLGSAIAFELALDTILIFVTLYLAFLFKDKKKNFPKYYIWYLSASIIYLVLDYMILASFSTTNSEMRGILDSTLSESLGSLIRTTVASVIWIAYMLKSKRVAGTFIK